MKIGRAKAWWKVPELWKNQKAVFPQLLGPSVHTSHNAGCYWTFLKHNFPSTPPADGGSGFGRPKEPLLHFGFARGEAIYRDLTSTTHQANSRVQKADNKNRHATAQRHGSGSLAGVHPDSLVPAAVTLPRLAVQMHSLSDIGIRNN